MKHFLIFAFILVCGLSVGCTQKRTGTPVRTLENDPAIKAIRESSRQIHDSLLVLKEKEHAHKTPKISHPEPTDPVLLMPITMKSWNGPAKAALEYIGMLTGYSTTSMGQKLAVEPMVSLNVIQTPAHLILQDIGIQIGDRAGILVKESSREITLVYRASSGN